MPVLKILSGSDLIKAFQKIGFNVHDQKGSHVKLRRIKESEKQTLTIPNHDEIDRGTLKAIFRQASRYISIDTLAEIFYIK